MKIILKSPILEGLCCFKLCRTQVNSLGILYDLEKKDIPKAIYFFKKAIEINSDLSSVSYAYSNILRIELLYNNYMDEAFENEFIQKFKDKDVVPSHT